MKKIKGASEGESAISRNFIESPALYCEIKSIHCEGDNERERKSQSCRDDSMDIYDARDKKRETRLPVNRMSH